MASRPTWNHLLKLGLDLGPEHFSVSRRPLQWEFNHHQPGAPAPVAMPFHRLRQMYNSRRLDAVPEMIELLRAPRSERMIGGVVAGDTRLSGGSGAATAAQPALVPVTTPVVNLGSTPLPEMDEDDIDSPEDTARLAALGEPARRPVAPPVSRGNNGRKR
jgi:hypothetical protein